jgi:hypothetical protein
MRGNGWQDLPPSGALLLLEHAQNPVLDPSSRILEKQNRVQTSQVFLFRSVDDQLGLAFQGFYKQGHFTQSTLLPPVFATLTPRRSEVWPH